jgi:hypothetical protein
MSRMLNKKTAAIVSVLFLVAAGGAYAYFSQSGGGTGTATTGTGVDIVVTQVSTPTGLTPGSGTQALSGTFTNPNTSPVHIVSVTAALAAPTGGAGTCTVANYRINTPTTTFGTPLVVAANGGTGNWSGPTIEMLDTGVNQDGCKGATVNITYTTATV